jgi:hypothetical protein
LPLSPDSRSRAAAAQRPRTFIKLARKPSDERILRSPRFPVGADDNDPRRIFDGAPRMKLVRIIGGVFAMVLLAAAITVYFAHPARSSDHQDSPTVVANPMEDITDVYSFPAPDTAGNVVFVMDFYPLIPSGQYTGISFDQNVLYQIKMANVAGNSTEHLVIQMKANSSGASPTFTLYGPSAPNEVGTANTLVANGQTFPFNQATTLANGVKVFVGPRRDPFYFDLAQFFKIIPDRNYKNQPNPPPPTASSFNFASGSQSIMGLGGKNYGTASANSCAIGTPSDFLANYDVESFVVSVPATMIVPSGGSPGKVGIWATASTPSGS